MQQDPFAEHHLYIMEDGRSVAINTPGFDRHNEAFELFRSLFDTDYGSIDVQDNLVAIHTGGWSDNEHLVGQFRRTWWWFRFFRAQERGGHYYFNTGNGPREWAVMARLERGAAGPA